ncbi:MAG TPA: cytochrome c peroxidase [Rhizobiaceae bacterium]|nr:cytochrome c peroxidase [Rhizobiaceae bacterium]
MALRQLALGIAAGGLALLAACQPSDFSEAEKATIASLSLAALPALPADPSNKYADERLAAAFGATLFFEQRLSRDGNVSCATCHKLDRQFQDDLPRSIGISETNRRSMPLAGVARSPFQFWDGRRDSLWAQALGPLEDKREHGGTRAQYAHFVKDQFGPRYERIFGPMPDLTAVPVKASPLGDDAERAAWDGMTAEQQDGVNRVFANLGKAIGAFERSIVHEETRFDRFAAALAKGGEPAGDAALSEEERYGLRLFIGKANCVQCHNGPRFTDDHFHNTGVPSVAGLPKDTGRELGAKQVLADAFNCLGSYSDAPAGSCQELKFMKAEGHELRRAFKTPSLRGAATRPPYMHSGQVATLDEVVDHYSRAPKSEDGESEVVPLKISDRERQALIAFLKALAE